MDRAQLQHLLEAVAAGRLAPADGLERLARLPFESLPFACVDHHRALRCGFPEVVFGQGKTPEQFAQIFERIAHAGAGVLATRVAPEAAARTRQALPAADYDPLSRTLVLRAAAHSADAGRVAVCAAGTADLPVAEEARRTADILGARVETFYDVGVAGIHRLLSQSDRLRTAHAIVVAAGMEGALPSVVGGLVSVPVIAVPTSIGYGASFGGLAALLGMLNSCAANVSVVNIDNGFGAGYQAALIARLASGSPSPDHGTTPRQAHERP